VRLTWTPQRDVWFALGISAVALGVCIALLVLAARRRRRAAVREVDDVDAEQPAAWSWRRPGRALGAGSTVGTVVASFAGAALVSRWPVAIASAAVALVTALVPRTRPLLGIAAAALLMAARTGHHPGLAWYALAFFAVTVATSVLGAVDDRASAPDAPDQRASADASGVDAV
jgi:hypothetical protein